MSTSQDKVCTSSTGEYKQEHFFRCRTCKINGVFAVCRACLETCHKGHEIEHAGFGYGECDCKQFVRCASFPKNEEVLPDEDVEPLPVLENDLNNLSLTEKEQCSFVETGKTYKQQQFYNCYTCGLTGYYGCCEVCVKNCHKGHLVSAGINLLSFCDCGIEGHSHCQSKPTRPTQPTQPIQPTQPTKPVLKYQIYPFQYGGMNRIDSTISDAIKDNVCTYTVTGESFKRQYFYRCYTCDLTGSFGCCKTCIDTCHKGHNISAGFLTNAFCDCGIKGTSTCCSKKKSTTPTKSVILCSQCETFFCEQCRPSKCVNHKTTTLEAKDFQCKCEQKKVDCTYLSRGKSYITQSFYRCKTCHLVGNLGFCQSCLKTCHSDHEYIYVGERLAYCDCHEKGKCIQNKSCC